MISTNQIISNFKKLNLKEKLTIGCFSIAVIGFLLIMLIVWIFPQSPTFTGQWTLWSPTYYSLGEQIDILIKEENHWCIYDDSSPYGANSEGTWRLSDDNKSIYFNWNNPRTKPTTLRIITSEDPSFDPVFKDQTYYLVSNDGNIWYK